MYSGLTQVSHANLVFPDFESLPASQASLPPACRQAWQAGISGIVRKSSYYNVNYNK